MREGRSESGGVEGGGEGEGCRRKEARAHDLAHKSNPPSGQF